MCEFHSPKLTMLPWASPFFVMKLSSPIQIPMLVLNTTFRSCLASAFISSWSILLIRGSSGTHIIRSFEVETDGPQVGICIELEL